MDEIKRCADLPVVAEADVGIGTWVDMVTRCLALKKGGFCVADVLGHLRASVVGRARESDVVVRLGDLIRYRQSALEREEANRDDVATRKAHAKAEEDIAKLKEQREEYIRKCTESVKGREEKLQKVNEKIVAYNVKENHAVDYVDRFSTACGGPPKGADS